MYRKVDRDITKWLDSNAPPQLQEHVFKQASSEKKELVLKDQDSDNDYGYSFPGLSPSKQLCLESIRELYDVTGKRPVVADIGAGFGTMTWKLLAAGARVDAFEIQVTTAKELQKRLEKMDPVIWDGEKLANLLKVYANDVISELKKQNAEHRYDIIWCSQVLHFFTPEQMLEITSLFKKVLKPDGMIFIEVNPVEAFQCFDVFKLIATNVEQAKKKNLALPGFVCINGATLNNESLFDAIEARIVTSVFDQEDMQKKSIPIKGKAYGPGYLGHEHPHEHERVFDTLKRPGYTYNIKRFHQIVNWMDDEIAEQYFGAAGFETSCYYYGTDGESLYLKTTINDKDMYNLSIFLKKSPELKLLDKKKEPFALRNLSIFKSTPHQYLQAEVKQFCGNDKQYEGFLKAIENQDYAMALRKASASGILPLVRVLLKFSTKLQLDINQPSPSNGFTALDWAIHAKDKDCPQKKDIIVLLERYGAVSKNDMSKKI